MTTVRDLTPALAALCETDVRSVLRETDACGVVDRSGTRVSTDLRYHATVYDVAVAADRRGEGVGRRLL